MPDEDVATEADPEADVADDAEMVDHLVHLQEEKSKYLTESFFYQFSYKELPQ
jgi:hypothetical protein